MTSQYTNKNKTKNRWKQGVECVRRVCFSIGSPADSHWWLTGKNDYGAIYHAGNPPPLLSPGIQQSPKQIKRRPAVVMGAAAGPAAHSQPPWLPLQQKSRRWFRPGSFVEVHMGAMIKTVQITEGVLAAPPPLPLTAALPALPPWENWGDMQKRCFRPGVMFF